VEYDVLLQNEEEASVGDVKLLNPNLYEDTSMQVTITRNTKNVQRYDMEYNQKMNPNQLEKTIDRIVMANQDQESSMDNDFVRFPLSEKVAQGSNILPTKAERKESVLAFDENGEFTTTKEILKKAVDEATQRAEDASERAEDSADSANQSEQNAKFYYESTADIIENANVNCVNLDLGSRIDGTASLTFGSRLP
jgi:hypothetical protein